jgi:8-oxo-dGTP pyrophosphatase MutT (NUDIX family)
MQIKQTTLLAVIDRQNNKVLMIKKLRGMKGFSNAADGMAKDLYNLPGGKVQPDESFFDSAVRETIEETGITPIDAKLCGQLQFVWPDLTLINQVFKTDKYSGDMNCATDECSAHWIDLDNLPYENMWGDDRTWFPDMMADKFFHYKAIMSNSEREVVMIPLPIEDIE